jgi:hypothetical protein
VNFTKKAIINEHQSQKNHKKNSQMSIPNQNSLNNSSNENDCPDEKLDPRIQVKLNFNKFLSILIIGFKNERLNSNV